MTLPLIATWQQYGGKTVQNVASRGEPNGTCDGDGDREGDNPQVFAMASLSTNPRDAAERDEEGERRGAARIRTGDGGFAIRCLIHLATAPDAVF